MRLLGLLLLSTACVNGQPQQQQQRRTNYQESLAVQLLHLSAAAYGNVYDECIVRSYPPQEGRYVFSSANITCDAIESSCEMYIVVSNVTREAIMVFRGTRSTGQLILEGWQSYAKGKEFYGMGTVNRYFNDAHYALWPGVQEFLNRPEFQSYGLTFTGHSLGGALAALAAARTVHEGLRPSQMVRLYTFGEPRLGSYEFAMNFDALRIESYRVVYRSDIIPHQPACEKDPDVPPTADGSRTCLAGVSNEAYHHGTEIWYPDSMIPGQFRYMECLGQPKNEDMQCSNRLTFPSETLEMYMWDHRHYFNVFVTGYGKSGCTNTTIEPPEKTPKFLARVYDFVSNIFDGSMG